MNEEEKRANCAHVNQGCSCCRRQIEGASEIFDETPDDHIVQAMAGFALEPAKSGERQVKLSYDPGCEDQGDGFPWFLLLALAAVVCVFVAIMVIGARVWR